MANEVRDRATVAQVLAQTEASRMKSIVVQVLAAAEAEPEGEIYEFDGGVATLRPMKYRTGGSFVAGELKYRSGGSFT